jgi:hypothetical protein
MRFVYLLLLERRLGAERVSLNTMRLDGSITLVFGASPRELHFLHDYLDCIILTGARGRL